MNKDRIVELIEGMKRWKIYEPPTPSTMGIRTRTTPWGEMRPYRQIYEDIDVVEKYLNSLTRAYKDYLKDTNVHYPPVALSDYIMNEGNDNE